METIATAGGEWVTRSYTVTVSDGQLTLLLDGRGGVDPNMVICGLQIVGVSPSAAQADHFQPPTDHATLDNLFANWDDDPPQ